MEQTGGQLLRSFPPPLRTGPVKARATIPLALVEGERDGGPSLLVPTGPSALGLTNGGWAGPLRFEDRSDGAILRWPLLLFGARNLVGAKVEWERD